MLKRKEKKVPSVTYHKYFKAHECRLSDDKMNTAYGQKCGRLRRFFLDLVTVRTGDVRARNLYK